MHSQTRYSLRIATEIRRREIADAARARLARADARRPQPIRRAIGRSIIRIGRRVAAEPGT